MTNNDTALEATHQDFLANAGWADATARPLAGDASTRRYLRLEKNNLTAILMIAPPSAEAAPCPPNADVAERQQLGYNATARLAGPNLHAFIGVANALNEAGLSAPKVFAAEPNQGLALIEDLGDNLFARIVDDVDEQEIYSAAINVLLALRSNPPKRPTSPDYGMLDYDSAALTAEAELLIDWYWPLKNGSAASTEIKAEYIEIINVLSTTLSPPKTMVLRDFHAENLLWLPDRDGVQRVGLIDFQDGLFGSAAYDLVSLLEDARRDVAPELASAMMYLYCLRAQKAGEFDRRAFLHDYAVLAAQRNAKILGIFARLAKRDSKPRYLDLLPRVEAHFRHDVQRPGLERLNQFFQNFMPGIFT